MTDQVSNLAEQSVYTRSESIISSLLEDKLVMLNVDTGEYYGLDEVGTSVWKQLESPCSCQQLVAQLMEEYKVPEARCEQEISHYLAQLTSKGIIQEQENI